MSFRFRSSQTSSPQQWRELRNVDTRGSDCGFFRAKHFCCRTATAIAFFRCGEFSPSLGKVRWTEFLSSHYLRISRHVFSKGACYPDAGQSACNPGVSGSGRMLPVCIQLGGPCAPRLLIAVSKWPRKTGALAVTGGERKRRASGHVRRRSTKAHGHVRFQSFAARI